MQSNSQDLVTAQRLVYGAHSTVHEAALFVEVPRQPNDDTWTCRYGQRTLRRWIGKIPAIEVVLTDAKETERSATYLGRPSIRTCEPREYLPSGLLQTQAERHSFGKRTWPMPLAEVLGDDL